MASLLSYALTTLNDVKESLGIASSDQSWDNFIVRNINKSTLAIENYCGRRFKETTYSQEVYNPTQTNELILRQRPVTNTQAFSFQVRGTGLNTDNWQTIDPELYFVDNSAGVVYGLFRNNGSWDRFRVSYSAGYASIPEDLAEACASLAAYYTVNAEPSSIGVQEKREGQRQIRYLNTTLNFKSILENLGIDSIINSYANYPLMSDQ